MREERAPSECVPRRTRDIEVRETSRENVAAAARSYTASTPCVLMVFLKVSSEESKVQLLVSSSSDINHDRERSIGDFALPFAL